MRGDIANGFSGCITVAGVALAVGGNAPHGIGIGVAGAHIIIQQIVVFRRRHARPTVGTAVKHTVAFGAFDRVPFEHHAACRILDTQHGCSQIRVGQPCFIKIIKHIRAAARQLSDGIAVAVAVGNIFIQIRVAGGYGDLLPRSVLHTQYSHLADARSLVPVDTDALIRCIRAGQYGGSGIGDRL